MQVSGAVGSRGVGLGGVGLVVSMQRKERVEIRNNGLGPGNTGAVLPHFERVTAT